MPRRTFITLIVSVLLAGAVTAWAVTAIPSTTAISVVFVGLIGLRILLHRRSS